MAPDPRDLSLRHTTPPSLEDIVALAETALDALPEALREMVRGTAIIVEEIPDDEILADLGLESAWELTGLYRGVPLTQKSVLDVPREPDTVLLFREPILLEWIETGEDLFRLVRNVLIHEIGHHFGLSDEDIERLERD
uniref:metallopeptidase family protein n=1 Tax=Siccirubricoccus phaeus TaxID=2595053 RepID=UPI0011F2A498|nr:metallopeptidase family protein [Siccirubricoccus phaeus]